MNDCPDIRFRKTRHALIWTGLLNEPLLTIYTLIAFILHKDLFATALQIAVLTMIRPLVSILSLYWSSLAQIRRGHVVKVVTAGVLSRLPFFFFPWFDSVWAIIASVAIYMMLTRGATPAWMEILRQNLPDGRRGMIFSWSSALSYLEGVGLAIGLGYLLDHQVEAWRWIFPLCAFIGMIGVCLQSKLRLPQNGKPIEEASPLSFIKKLCLPWKQAFDLMRQRPDFRRFQWAFMFGGIGIMVIQPALPLFFVDVLKVSYTDLAIALSVCKGIGFALSSPFWGKWMNRMSLPWFTTLIFIFMGSFPLLLLLAPSHLFWLYLAYTFYGISQAGSHLLWNLSGPLFAKETDSSVYTGVNVVMVGVRGAVAPPLGSLLCAMIHPAPVLLVGGLFFALGSYYVLQPKSQRELSQIRG